MTGAVRHIWLHVVGCSVAALMIAAPSPTIATQLSLPVGCALGQNCFVQQYPDMASGPTAVDPFCGHATYDGHKGIDIRLLSMADIARKVPVLAMADGKVLRGRDGVPDRLVVTAEDRKAVQSKECGNGVVIDHGHGIEVQYCHMKRGSIIVKDGEAVKRGDKIGEIGASGLTQFPHIHVTVRRNGVVIDPVTGRATGKGCEANPSVSESLFPAATLQLLGRGEPQIMSLGFSGNVVKHAELVKSGPPSPPSGSSQALVGWAWLINLHENDQISIKVVGPSGSVVARQTTKPAERAKASYLAYAGKNGAPAPGPYIMAVTVLRGGKPILTRTRQYDIE